MKRMHRRSLVFAAAMLSCVAPAAVRADAPIGMQTGDLKITTDSTDYNINTGDFTMPHHISGTRPGTRIDGDRAHGNGKRRVVTIEGHVVVHQDGGTNNALIGGMSSTSSDPSTLTSDSLTIELTTKVYTAVGHVHFTQGTQDVTADRAVLTDLTHDLHLTGHVHVQNAGQSLEAETVDYNTRTEQVHANKDVRISVPVETPAPGSSPVPAASAEPSHRPRRRLL